MNSEKVTAKAYVDVATLTDFQREQLEKGLNACYAFWTAAQQLPTYEIVAARPHKRCIQSALAVADIMRKGVGARIKFQRFLYIRRVAQPA